MPSNMHMGLLVQMTISMQFSENLLYFMYEFNVNPN